MALNSLAQINTQSELQSLCSSNPQKLEFITINSSPSTQNPSTHIISKHNLTKIDLSKSATPKEMPRCFTRSKRRRNDLYDDNDSEVEQHHQKIARTFVASIQPD